MSIQSIVLAFPNFITIFTILGILSIGMLLSCSSSEPPQPADTGVSDQPTPVADVVAPQIEDIFPDMGAAAMPTDTKIHFRLKDSDSGIDRSSINIEINETPVNPVISGDSENYLVEYQPGDGFIQGETVEVVVIALDLASTPNRLEYTFNFSIEKAIGPPNVDDHNNVRLNIIYYGKHDPTVDALIISVAPQYIIGNPAHGLWGEAYGYDTWWLLQNVDKFQEAEIKVIGYLTSGYEGTGSSSGIELKWYSLEMNRKLIINMAEKDRVDGIFIDECSSYPNARSKEYLKALSDLAHSYGLVVWGNVGHEDFDDWYFKDGGFDMMNTNENWRGQTLTPVQRKWGQSISVSGFFDGHDPEDAYDLIKDAWDKGLAYAYITTDAYAQLPPWIKQLGELIRADK